MQQYHLSFFTEYYQFYVLDSQTTSQTDDANFWNNEADINRLAVLDGLIGVTVAKYAKIDVELRFLDKKPTQITDAQHIVETSLALPSGVFEVRDCTSYDLIHSQTLPAGSYQVRVSSFNLDTVQSDEGKDYYVVEVWESSVAKTKIIKKYVPK